MKLQVEWDNAEKTIIRITYTEKWTWSDFYAANTEAVAMMKTVQHTVHFLADFRQSRSLPLGGAITPCAQRPERPARQLGAAGDRLDQCLDSAPRDDFPNGIQRQNGHENLQRDQHRRSLSPDRAAGERKYPQLDKLRKARSGSSNPNILPSPSVLLKRILPPCRSMIFLTRCSPSPVPSIVEALTLLARKNG